MKQLQHNEDLRAYRTYGFPLLALMGLIGLTGIVLTAVIHFVF